MEEVVSREKVKPQKSLGGYSRVKYLILYYSFTILYFFSLRFDFYYRKFLWF
jgi:hypothetical protein